MTYIYDEEGNKAKVYEESVVDSLFGFQRRKRNLVISLEDPLYNTIVGWETRKKVEKILKILKGGKQ